MFWKNGEKVKVETGGFEKTSSQETRKVPTCGEIVGPLIEPPDP